MLAHDIPGGHIGDRAMSALKPPRCLICVRPMQLLRKTSRFGGLPDLYSFYCCVCDEWHVEKGEARNRLQNLSEMFIPVSLEIDLPLRSCNSSTEVNDAPFSDWP